MMIILIFYFMIIPVQAESYVVMSGADNTIIEEKNKDEVQSVASISKIMTCILAIEYGNLDEEFKVDEEVLAAYGSSIYLKQGQTVSLKDLLYGLMLRSGNDAAVEIANHVAGSNEAFVKLMNEKASEIGMSNTVFHNPSGLDEEDDGNLSTAHDMAILMSYAMKNETFNIITGSKYYTNSWNLRWQNKNKLLFDFPFATGGKTGFTKKAGRTLVTAAEHNGVSSIVVTLKIGDDFSFHKEKHTETFQTMEVVTLLKKGDIFVNNKTIRVDEDIRITLHKDGSDKMHIQTHFEGNIFVMEIIKNNEVQVYSFTGE